MQDTSELKDEIDHPQDPEEDENPYKPDKAEKIVRSFVKQRVKSMKDWRKSLNIEKRWDEADKEYLPNELEPSEQTWPLRKHYETDQQVGLRAPLIRIGDDANDWRSQMRSMTLLNKIQIALALIIEQDPEAALIALEKKYEKTIPIARALWKRSWAITRSVNILKLIAFDMMKYGWAVQRTFPRKIKFDKEVLTEFDPADASKNKYETKENLFFNDVFRQRLDPRRTWIDETTRPYDHYSMNDCYYEIDYTYDQFVNECSQYPNWKFVKKDSLVQEQRERYSNTGQEMKRKDLVTVGFYENRLKDLYEISVPVGDITLFSGPHPNDDSELSISHAFWILRDANLPFGTSLWEIIRQDKKLFDKMQNMTMDQLTLSIYKMFFYTGTSNFLNDGMIKIEPGVGKQIINGKVDWMNIPGPGQDSWKGLEYLKNQMDGDSGVGIILEGNAPKGRRTMGELLQQKESALKRMKTPIENIADLVDQDAYISLSWMAQLYSTPQLMEFDTPAHLLEFEAENDVQHQQIYQDGSADTLKATFLPQLALHLEDRNGQLTDSKNSQFMQVGQGALKTAKLKWRGIFKTIPKSIVSPSATLERQSKLELSNILVPMFQQDPQIMLKPAQQILEIYEEDPEDWFPDTWMQLLKGEGSGKPLFTDPNNPGGQPGAVPGNQSTMSGASGMSPPRTPTVTPQRNLTGAGKMPGINANMRQ